MIPQIVTVSVDELSYFLLCIFVLPIYSKHSHICCSLLFLLFYISYNYKVLYANQRSHIYGITLMSFLQYVYHTGALEDGLWASLLQNLWQSSRKSRRLLLYERERSSWSKNYACWERRMIFDEWTCIVANLQSIVVYDVNETTLRLFLYHTMRPTAVINDVLGPGKIRDFCQLTKKKPRRWACL